MPVITDLPTELLEIILGLAGKPLTQTKVCRVFNQITTTSLYRHVKLKDSEYNQSPWRTNRVHSIHPFLRTIIGQPVLGGCVRHLEVELSNGCGNYNAAASTTLIEAAASWNLSQDVTQHTLPAESILFLLLCYLPALENLEIYPFTPSTKTFLAKVSKASTLPPGLQSIRFASVSNYDGVGGSSLGWGSILPLFRLPALSTFSCWAAYIGNADTDDEDSLLPDSSTVRDIALWHSHVCDDRLKAMIHSSRYLRTLCYEPATRSITFHAPSIGDALRQCALNTLERLDLYFRDDASFAQIGSLGSLRDFVNLTHISAPPTLLFDPPDVESNEAIAHRLSMVLPASLVSLTLLLGKSKWETDDSDVVERFAASKRVRLPLLRDLNLEAVISDESTLADLRSACATEGIELSLC